MFLYRGSKLEQDINDLKNQAKKSDYEKTIEPFQTEINDLQRQLYYQKKDIEALYSASIELLRSLDKEYLHVIINTHEPKAYYSEMPEFEVCESVFKRITIPVKQDLLEHFANRLYYFKDKYKEILEVGDKDESKDI